MTDDAALLAELAALYREVDALYAGWSCPSTTECCRFGMIGRQPYVTSIELAALQRGLARRGAPLAPKKRALPITADGESERICPMLDRSGLCTVYADRPFGCRTFYCDRATRGPRATREELRDAVRKLQDLAARHALGGDQPRPLVRALCFGNP